ncbi:CRISPR-associated protein Cas1 [Arcanobacterium wilhelmae]|uniref:CRISPR-associated endonuclease Cas1 n=1 Tax=Arcanobacterium wilhelmae TaxID=1803177 RepID=A0ABT9NAX7_9ACTO|nr:type II CRISPR-associated endonuclease Cas1 [Arcanobacterium wilhelmae]MDP9800361.1 CRISPR-associated protein Cas1 [Arcanobacterium wilhelmae]
MEQWRILDCSTMRGKLCTKRGALSVEREDSPPVLLPVADIAVALIGISVSFSAAVIHQLAKHDVAIVFCDWKGVPESAAYSWSEHGRVGARHRAQASLPESRRKSAWAQIIRAKVKGQANVLAKAGSPRSALLRKLASSVRSGDPANVEAQAARAYWQELWGDEGFHRIPGGNAEATDPRNAYLDYAYTVLRGHGIRAVIGAGLCPTLGIFHKGRGNNFALVDDLIEPFRPAIDSAILELKPDLPIEDPHVRRALVEASSQTFLQDGTTIASAFGDLAQHYARYVEGDVDRLTVPHWRGDLKDG